MGVAALAFLSGRGPAHGCCRHITRISIFEALRLTTYSGSSTSHSLSLRSWPPTTTTVGPKDEGRTIIHSRGQKKRDALPADMLPLRRDVAAQSHRKNSSRQFFIATAWQYPSAPRRINFLAIDINGSDPMNTPKNPVEYAHTKGSSTDSPMAAGVGGLHNRHRNYAATITSKARP